MCLDLNMKDENLVKNVRENRCDKSLRELISRHSPLCYNIYKRYASALKKNCLDYSDIKGEKDYIIYNSCISFKPDKKVKFSTWLGNYTRYYYLNLINKNKNYISVDSDELIYFADKNCMEDEGGENLGEFKDYIMNLLKQVKDPRIESIFKLRYFSNKNKMTWNEISRELNVSIQTAINLHSKGLGILKNKVESENLSDLI